ncbi:hypothetical protein ILYODFUR_034880 [Ilyodon furcidens]|uniref:Uncharacterized protein n=1 Tax=Ilyodon furcidens TaxID=33524 RepID=A0ABV0UAX8_9TELE
MENCNWEVFTLSESREHRRRGRVTTLFHVLSSKISKLLHKWTLFLTHCLFWVSAKQLNKPRVSSKTLLTLVSRVGSQIEGTGVILTVFLTTLLCRIGGVNLNSLVLCDIPNLHKLLDQGAEKAISHS